MLSYLALNCQEFNLEILLSVYYFHFFFFCGQVLWHGGCTLYIRVGRTSFQTVGQGLKVGMSLFSIFHHLPLKFSDRYRWLFLVLLKWIKFKYLNHLYIADITIRDFNTLSLLLISKRDRLTQSFDIEARKLWSRYRCCCPYSTDWS